MERQTSGKLAKKCCQNCASYKKPKCLHPIRIESGARPFVARKFWCELYNTDKAAAGQSG
jgi:hypothetical protein